MLFRISLVLLGFFAGQSVLAFDRVPFAKQGCVMGDQIYVPGENGVAPPMPERANQLPKLRGSATFEFVVSAEGSVCEVVVKRSASSDAQLAVAKMRGWKFRPAQKDGRAVAVRFTLNLNNTR